jgi:MFS family permease
MPQPLAAMGLKLLAPRLLTRFGYRNILLTNTFLIGLMMMLFATIQSGTPVALIVALALCFGFTASLQYTSMNTLAYSDIENNDAGMASTIASTVQQLSISFGIATASLAAGLFIPDKTHASAEVMLSGLHKTFLCIGVLTVMSSLVFRKLRPDDGENVSLHRRHSERSEGSQDVSLRST